MDDRRDPRTYAIIGAAMQVHRELGPGYLESVYQRALAIELEERGIPHRREAELEVTYHGQSIGAFRADFLCHESIIVELKAGPSLGNVEIAQLANYLRATGHRLGLLLGFGSTSLGFRRVVEGHAVPSRYELDADPQSVELQSASRTAANDSVSSAAPTLGR